ncbi:hypothetical protein C9439_03910 [archaeon SCG-AAA382B04]|nr:hypothetical protein C9439_03910 [archaeon SCG-AAA382B04]
MNSPPTYFLDTSIFLGYAVTQEELEKHHEECGKIINEEEFRESSEKVKKELLGIKKRRENAYKHLIKLITREKLKNKEIKNNFPMHLSNNDVSHLKELVKYLKGVYIDKRLTFMRKFIKTWKNRLNKAIDKIYFCLSEDNPQLRDILFNHPELDFGKHDTEILIDAHSRSKDVPNLCFVTQDQDMIDGKKIIEELFVHFSPKKYDRGLDGDLPKEKWIIDYLHIKNYE